MPPKDGVAEFWRSAEGLDIRAKQWGDYSTYQVYNKLINTEARYNEATHTRFMTQEDDRVDHWCIPFNRKVYRIGQFKPVLPRHHNCRCYWEPVWQ